MYNVPECCVLGSHWDFALAKGVVSHKQELSITVIIKLHPEKSGAPRGNAKLWALWLSLWQRWGGWGREGGRGAADLKPVGSADHKIKHSLVFGVELLLFSLFFLCFFLLAFFLLFFPFAFFPFCISLFCWAGSSDAFSSHKKVSELLLVGTCRPLTTDHLSILAPVLLLFCSDF